MLHLPSRTEKKRERGLTCILDKGLGIGYVEDILKNAHPYVDVAKFGWGTSILSLLISKKIQIYRNYQIEVSTGGTLFELFYLQSKLDEFAEFLKDLGVDIVEISDGTIDMPREDKLKWIGRFKKDFKVYSEVGSKDVEFVTPPAQWARWIKEELEAGADYVMLEGRESGTVGLYRETGEIRMGLVNEIIESGIIPEKLIFEAPRKHQQVWFIKRFGANVNLANVPLEEVISLETLRQGLRSDTLKLFHQI
jgi:phosphosulfolactate synthase